MENLFKVINLDNIEKIGNLKAEAHSVVKSTKYFPIYMIHGKKMIFKPLSRTKPLTTPFFAYSEVYWSYILNKYFDDKTPRYYLAISNGIEKEQPKYYNKGVLVESLTPNDEKLINLYDYFMKNPDASINIKDYENYCMVNYDYTKILNSDFIKNNRQIGEELAYQILLSILRQDRNFHYENINFYEKEGSVTLAPPIDFEFSIPFLYPDNKLCYDNEQQKYINSIRLDSVESIESSKVKQFLLSHGLLFVSDLTSNICLIVKKYPDVVEKFILNLEKLIEDLPNIVLTDPDNYIGPLNSDYWEVGHAYFKTQDMKKYEQLKSMVRLVEINKEFTFNKINQDILDFSKKFNLILKTYLYAHNKGIDNLESLTIKSLLSDIGIKDEVTIEDIDIKTKQLKLGVKKND